MSTVKPYEIRDVPERDDGGSRFHLQTSPGGFGTDPSENIAACYSHLVADRERETTAAAPPEVRVELYAAIGEPRTGYRLKRRGLLIVPKMHEASRPTRAARLTLPPGALLDSLLTGEGEGWDRARDQDCWRALLQVAEFHSLTGRALRNVNEHVARCLAVRAGIEAPHPSALPAEHLWPEPRALPATEPEQSEDDQEEAA